MTPTEFGKLIKTDFHGIFLFYGEEQYLKQYYLKLAQKNTCGDGTGSVVLSGEGQSLSVLCQTVMETASMPSMDMSKRFINIYDVEWKKASEDDLAFLEDCLSVLKEYDDVVVVFDTRPENFDAGTEKKPSKLFARLNKILTTVGFVKESPAKLASWIQKHFSASKVSADMNVCNMLVKYCGRDMTTLNNEISKLTYYVLQNGRNTVTESDIHIVSSIVNEIDAFDFSNAIIAGDSERAFSILNEMKLHKEAPEVILGSIMKTYSEMYTVKILAESGIAQADISKKTGIHEYRVGIYSQRVKSLSKNGLQKAISLCHEADLKIKSFSFDSYDTLDILLIKLFMTGRLK
ncbi:MAG: DNA polymerase III subunit delta [Ruminococcaceae bacterium]|nr:DNA polymerase III subunit delta [Oscillospiraceae bacterium]